MAQGAALAAIAAIATDQAEALLPFHGLLGPVLYKACKERNYAVRQMGEQALGRVLLVEDAADAGKTAEAFVKSCGDAAVAKGVRDMLNTGKLKEALKEAKR